MDVLFLGGWFVIMAGVLGLVVGSRFERRRWKQHLMTLGIHPEGVRSLRPDAGADLGAARQDRLERAVEAIGIEVERISENQRFVTRLLSERRPSDSDRRDTPRSPLPGSLRSPHSA